MSNFYVFAQKMGKPTTEAQIVSVSVDFNEAFQAAEEVFAAESKKSRLSVFIRDEADTGAAGAVAKSYLSFTSNAQILGHYVAQVWGDDDDYLEDVKEVIFDATGEILSLDYQTFMALSDCSPESDEIGRQCVQWEGPFSVYLLHAINDFFGVSDIKSVTEEMFQAAVNEVANSSDQEASK